MMIPFLDLEAQYRTIRPQIEQAIAEVLESRAFAGGPFVEKFEEQFARFGDREFAIGVGSGTEALWLALKALGIGAGDEVITVPNSFMATVEAIVFCGATPVFVDIDERAYNMDPRKLEQVLTQRTAAIIPVHLYGQMADMDPIMDFARRHHLDVIEDACQAHGAEYKGRKAGTIGHLGCFSFYPGKNLGAYGDAGAVVTNDRQWASKIKMIRDHGQSKKYQHDLMGWNARMDGIQAAILSVKLAHLPRWNEARRRHAALYSELLAKVAQVVTPCEAEDRKHVYHVYAIRTPRREALGHYLDRRQIASGIHYPVPLHRQPAWRATGSNGSFPVTERFAAETLSLPMFPELTSEQVAFVADHIRKFTEGGAEQ
jgi:dTDP-4-amino-4,6-dideoxygalactose transaminase